MGRRAIQAGIDVVDVEDVATALRDYPDRYLRRVYTRNEVADASRCGRPDAARLAARFAAKEATMKALRVGDEAMPWHAIEVVKRADGAPELRLTGAARRLADAQGVVDIALSITHERSYAAAVVIAEVDG